MPSSSSKLKQFCFWLIQWRLCLLLLALAVGAASIPLGQSLSFERSVESMFADNDPELRLYRRFRDLFGGGDMVLAVYRDRQLLAEDGSGLVKLRDRANQLAFLPGVRNVMSLVDVNEALIKAYTLDQLLGRSDPWPLLRPDDPVASRLLGIFDGQNYSRAHGTVAIICQLESAEQGMAHEEILSSLRPVVGRWPEGVLTGEPVLVVDGFRLVSQDASRLNRNCLLLMALVLVACFRSLRWVLIPMAVMQLSLLATHGLLVILGWRLTMVSAMLSAIVVVISVATTVHIAVRFAEARSQGHSRKSALFSALLTLSVPITWACLTDAVAFTALSTATVEPVRDFGWMMAIASMMVLLMIFLVVPGASLLGRVDTDPHSPWGESMLRHWLIQLSRFIESHARTCGIVSVAGLILLAVGMFFLRVETDFTKNFREDTEIIRAYRFVENELGGAGLIDVVVSAPPRLNPEFLARVSELQRELGSIRFPSGRDRGELAVTHVLSFSDANQAMREHRWLGMIAPDLQFHEFARSMPGFAEQLMTQTRHGNAFRIMLRTRQQRGAAQQDWLVDRVRAIVQRSFPGESPETEPMTTGFFVLLARLVNSVLNDQAKTFSLATILVFAVLLVAFGRPRLACIALVPNVLPIVALLGSLGWLGVKLNMGAAMIAAVSIGLTVDGTIHYLYQYVRRKREGCDTASSIRAVQQQVGRAVVYSTLAMVVGFASLCVSAFVPTIFFGALVGLSMLGGLFGNLVLLPVLLTVFDKDSRSAAVMESVTDV